MYPGIYYQIEVALQFLLSSCTLISSIEPFYYSINRCSCKKTWRRYHILRLKNAFAKQGGSQPPWCLFYIESLELKRTQFGKKSGDGSFVCATKAVPSLFFSFHCPYNNAHFQWLNIVFSNYLLVPHWLLTKAMWTGEIGLECIILE